MKIRLNIQPHDTLFFRSPRYYGGLDAISAAGESSLLPRPSIIFGAVRQRLWEEHKGPGKWDEYCQNWAEWPSGKLPQDPLALALGPIEISPRKNNCSGQQPTGSWPRQSLRMHGVLPNRCCYEVNETLFPLPGFVMLEKGRKMRPEFLASAWPRSSSGRFASVELPVPLQLPRLDPVLPADLAIQREQIHGFIDRYSFVNLLKGQAPPVAISEVVAPERMASEEGKVGIGRDNNLRTTKEGHLYFFNQYRWRANHSPNKEQYGLTAILEADFDLSKLQGGCRLGGKNHLAWFSPCSGMDTWLDPNDSHKIIDAIVASRHWYMTLATPAVFARGWCPAWLKGCAATGWQVCSKKDDDSEISKLCGVLLGKIERQSGWNLLHKRPKPFLTVVPAGSTWFFTTGSLSPAKQQKLIDFLNELQGKCISDYYDYAGYGLAFVGSWNPHS